MDWPEDALWDHALALWRRPGVEAACLELQRRHGLDVDLLMLGCWLATRGVELAPPLGDQARAATEDWQAEVVRPLRAIRRRLGARLANPEPASAPALFPALAAQLRARLLDLEIDAERLDLLALHRAVSPAPATASPGPTLAWRNIAPCGVFEAVDRAALATLLRAAFPDADPAEVGACLSALDD